MKAFAAHSIYKNKYKHLIYNILFLQKEQLSAFLNSFLCSTKRVIIEMKKGIPHY